MKRAWLSGLAGLLGALSLGAADPAPDQVVNLVPPSAEHRAERYDYAGGSLGLICWTAILEAMSDIGKRCEATEEPRFRSAVDQSLARLERHLEERGGWSTEQIARFRVQMSESDRPTDVVCRNDDARLMYDGMVKAGSSEIVRATDELISRPGAPEWGSCL